MKRALLKFRRIFIIGVNIAIMVVAYVAAFYLRFEFTLPAQYFYLILETIPFLIIIKAITFYYFGLYAGLWKYVSIEDIWQILKANIVASVLFVLYIVFSRGLVGFPRSIFLLDWGICVALLSGVRIISRAFRENLAPRKYHNRKNVLIVGAGEAGVLVLNELRKNMNYDIVGFIDDNVSKKGMTIKGKKILGGKNEIKDIVKDYDIHEIILAMPSQKGSVIREVINFCRFPNIDLKIVPGMYKILSGELEVKFREVEPEDLLGREMVNVDKKEIYNYLKKKRVLITGAAGSIGSELCRQIASFEPESLILLDLNENDMYFLEIELKKNYPNVNLQMVMGDIKDIGLLKHIFTQQKPQIIFHAAAYKHVPMMEIIPSAAIKNNVIGTRNIIYAADHYKAERLVCISTDKAVHPTSIMGITKRIGEMLIQAKNPKSETKLMAVRFGNVLGSKGSVVPLFKEQIRAGGPVTVTHPEARRYFMSVKEAVELVLQAGALGKGGEIFVLDMGEQIRIRDLAENLIILSGLRPQEDIGIEYTGLRSGEKIFEETLHDKEKDKATKNDKIFITVPEDFEINTLNKDVKDLEKLANAMDENAILGKIKKMVPLYNAFGERKE